MTRRPLHTVHAQRQRMRARTRRLAAPAPPSQTRRRQQLPLPPRDRAKALSRESSLTPPPRDKPPKAFVEVHFGFPTDASGRRRRIGNTAYNRVDSALRTELNV